MKEQVAETVLWIILLIPTLFGGWVALGYYLAAADLGVLYKKFSRERFGIIDSPKRPRVLFNSAAFVLLNDPNFVAGRFCPLNKMSEKDRMLPRYPGPSWFERYVMGGWFIGWPFVDELFRKELSWIGVGDGKTFAQHSRVRSDSFAITKLYVLKFRITLGKDDARPESTSQESQNIILWVYLVAPIWIFDPYTAMVQSDWMQGVEGAISPHLQQVAQTMDLDEMNAVVAKGRNDRGQLAEAAITNAGLAEKFGVKIEEEGVHQAGYEFENTAIGEAIKEASVKLYRATQEAGATKRNLMASQAGAEELSKITHDLYVKLTSGDKPLTPELASMVTERFLGVQKTASFRGDVLAEAGTQTPIAISTERKGKGKGK